MGYIYRILNKVSRKCYIGESKEKNVERRWNDHIRLINQGKGCPALRDAVGKYGWDNFKFEVLLVCFDEDRFIYEKEYIKKYNSQVPNGYNITEGGEGGGFKGKKHSEQTKEKIREYFKKYYSDPEKRRENGLKIKQAFKDKNINMREKLMKSDKWKEAVKRLSEIQLKRNYELSLKSNGAILSTYGKKILQLTVNDYPLFKYKDIKQASQKTKIGIESIRKVLKGQQQTAGGFIWKLIDS